MRKIALTKGLSLSEYGFKDMKAENAKNIIDTSDIINSEEDIFKYLGMPYVEPSKR
jgi:DNA polymerase/3'-5' exonuclease PolX